MSVAFVSTSGAGQQNSTGANINVPASVVDGNVMVLAVYLDRTTVTLTTPSGWSAVTGVTNPQDQSTNARSYLFQRVCSSEPSTYAISFSGACYWRASIVAYSGNDTTTPVNIAGLGLTSSTSTPQTAVVTPTAHDCMVIGFFGCDPQATSKLPISPGTSSDTTTTCTERAENEVSAVNKVVSYVEDYFQVTAAAVQVGMTASGAVAWMTYIVAIQPPTPTSTVANPTADSVDGSWTDQADTTNLTAAIDEVTPSDADYIKSEVSPANSGCRVKLSGIADPLTSSGHTIRWRIAKSAGSGTMEMTVKLYQGGGNSQGAGTLIASFTRSDIPATFMTYSEILSSAQANSITNYTDLYLEFFANET